MHVINVLMLRMQRTLFRALYNAYKLYTHAIYLNNVWLTVLLEMVCITYQIGYAMHVTNIMHASFLEYLNVIIQCL